MVSMRFATLAKAENAFVVDGDLGLANVGIQLRTTPERDIAHVEGLIPLAIPSPL